MAYGRPANVRSHRRGVRERRRRVAPWISVTVVCLLVAAGLTVGYRQLLAQTCSGQHTVQVVAAPATANLLGTIATDWGRREPATADGTCAQVVVQSRDSAQVAAELATGWEDDDQPPDVWVPASTAWAQQAAASQVAEPLVPDLRPSIARSPTVIAMPEPMAAALGWPEPRLGDDDAPVRWESLLDVLAEDLVGWSRFGHPEWGSFRFGMSNPARDTAGLLALTAVVDTDQTGEASDSELGNASRLHALVEPQLYHETTEQLLTALREADTQGGEQAALRHVSAFPALEQNVLDYNRGDPEVPLVALYPTDDTVEADHPYLVLDAEWVDGPTREVAELFLAYVRSAGPQQLLRQAGFRGTNREAGGAFTEQNGVVAEVAALPRGLLVPDSVSLAVDQWTALARPSNVLLVLDVSDSMSAEVPGTDRTRMEQASAAAVETLRLFTDDDQVGFWEFSTGLSGDRDYRELVPMGSLGDLMFDSRSRRDHILEAVENRAPEADTAALYGTVRAAFDTVLASYDPEASNMVVIVTDGVEEAGDESGTSRAELLAHLEEAPADGEQVRVVHVAFGDEPGVEVLHEVSAATGGEVFYSSDGFNLVELLRRAVFSVAP